ncbi:MAG TPA: DUF4097 family beta strand repeat-containing protein [Nevskiaceae bacterium]|nr:DUF4097 family beta strand repeat-containing protein [Nevskiaceae bacterium]
MNPLLKTFAFAALAGLGSAHAGTPIQEERSLNGDAKVYVANSTGSITVRGWDRRLLKLSGELGAGGPKLEISGDAADLRIEVRAPKDSHRYEGTDLILSLPSGVRLEVVGVSSDVDVQGLSGALQAHSVSGDVRLDVSASEVKARTVSGDLRLRGPVRRCHLNSVSGDLHAEGPSDQLTLETVSGNVVLQGGPFRTLAAKSISGDMNLQVSLEPEAVVEGETLSGQIQARLQGSPSAEVSLRSFSGHVHSELAGTRPVVSREDRLEFTLGQGRGRIDLSSFSGDIELLK